MSTLGSGGSQSAVTLSYQLKSVPIAPHTVAATSSQSIIAPTCRAKPRNANMSTAIIRRCIARLPSRPANVDDAGRTDLVHASRRSDATALGQSSLDTAHGATGHRWPTNALSRREGLRLPVADGLRELGASVFLMMSSTAGLVAPVSMFVQVQGDAAIPKEAEDFQQVRDCRPGRRQRQRQRPDPPYRGWRSNDAKRHICRAVQPTVIRIYWEDGAPMVLDSSPERIR